MPRAERRSATPDSLLTRKNDLLQLIMIVDLLRLGGQMLSHRDAPSRCSFTAAVASAVALAGITFGVGHAEVPNLPITEFPHHYDYPLHAGVLMSKVAQRDTAYLRRHAWYLWAGINQPVSDGWPLWASWPIATQVFAITPAAGEMRAAAAATTSLASLNALRQITSNISQPFYEVPAPVRQKYHLAPTVLASKFADGQTFQNNGDVMLVSESYDEAAFSWVRERNLYLRSTLNRLLPQREMPPMPNVSIVLKHMYWPVTKDGLTALPVVDMSRYDQVDPAYVGFEDKAHWPNAVAIDPSGQRVGQRASVTYLYDVFKNTQVRPQPLGPITYANARVVGLSDFYWKKLSQKEFNALSTNDRLLIDASFYWAHGRMFEDGDYLVSIASHIITKEMPSWTLQTVWWHPDANSGAFAKDRPDIPTAKGPWRHYLLTLEDGIPDASDPQKLPIAYNPYIELAANHAVNTNCRNCHMRAATPNGNYLPPGGPGPLAVFGFDSPVFNDKLRTDFLWTIADRAYPLPPTSK